MLAHADMRRVRESVCVRACVRACVRGWVGGWVHVYVCVCAKIFACACNVCVQCMHVNVCMDMHADVCAYAYIMLMCVRAFVYLHVCVSVHIYTYVNTSHRFQQPCVPPCPVHLPMWEFVIASLPLPIFLSLLLPSVPMMCLTVLLCTICACARLYVSCAIWNVTSHRTPSQTI